MRSVTSLYYDVDDFLSQEDVVPVTTKFEFTQLGHLKEDLGTRDLPEKTRLMMPVWALDKWSALNFVQLRLPKRYSQAAREAITADPLNYEVTPTYFSTGKAIASLGGPENKHGETKLLRETLLKTYTGPRLAKTLDWALCNSHGEDVSEFLSGLTFVEKRLYQLGSNKRRRLMP